MSSFAFRLRSQWANPRDIFSILLLVGGDVVQAAIAQTLTTRRWSLPVPFSFGWVSFALLSLNSAISRGKLMPKADVDCVCVNLADGNTRQNQSFALGRLLRDFESWSGFPPSRPDDYRLVIAVYNSLAKDQSDDASNRSRRSSSQMLYHWLSLWDVELVCLGTILIQCALAALSVAMYEERSWEVLIVTLAGGFLSFFTSFLPEWREEKFGTRTLKNDKDIALTQGQGSRHVIILQMKAGDTDLQALSTAQATMSSSSRLVLVALFLAWTALLITATSIDVRSWYILGIGLIGMVSNVYLAGNKQQPKAWGFQNLVLDGDPIRKGKVMATLEALEENHEGWGCALLPVFFEETSLDAKEEEYWKGKKEVWRSKHLERRAKGKLQVGKEQGETDPQSSESSSEDTRSGRQSQSGEKVTEDQTGLNLCQIDSTRGDRREEDLEKGQQEGTVSQLN